MLTRKQWKNNIKGNGSKDLMLEIDWRLTSGKSTVLINRNDELSRGEYIYSLIEDGNRDDSFDCWLESFDTEEEAIEFCAVMGWKIKEEVK